MAYIQYSEQQKEQARRTDLCELLRSQGEQLKRSSSEYEWRDSSEKVTIRGNLWFHQYEQKGGECWPAIPTIARELKLTESTIRRALRDLRRGGYLTTEQRYRKRAASQACSIKYEHRSAKKDTTYYQGRTAPIWWQVVPVIMAGQVNYPP